MNHTLSGGSTATYLTLGLRIATRQFVIVFTGKAMSGVRGGGPEGGT